MYHLSKKHPDYQAENLRLSLVKSIMAPGTACCSTAEEFSHILMVSSDFRHVTSSAGAILILLFYTNMLGCVYTLGDQFEGEFADGLRSGAGTLVYAHGDAYTGHFALDLPEGMGTLTYTSGDSYTGEFKGGKRHGLGKHSYVNTGW